MRTDKARRNKPFRKQCRKHARGIFDVDKFSDEDGNVPLPSFKPSSKPPTGQTQSATKKLPDSVTQAKLTVKEIRQITQGLDLNSRRNHKTVIRAFGPCRTSPTTSNTTMPGPFWRRTRRGNTLPPRRAFLAKPWTIGQPLPGDLQLSLKEIAFFAGGFPCLRTSVYQGVPGCVFPVLCPSLKDETRHVCMSPCAIHFVEGLVER